MPITTQFLKYWRQPRSVERAEIEFINDHYCFIVIYILQSQALIRGLRPEKLQLNVSIYFLFDIKDIFNHLLANKIKTINYSLKTIQIENVWGALKNSRYLQQDGLKNFQN